ncbi:helix-turn-helix transcriptional regulator [Actinosynnema pretiosum subsp. pretiosum]|uniref:Transcriptional regulator, TetR family n=2 Tax=Actinosynnema TaxID=40566 RepID=C6WKA5_ACTMD|nr:TetR/AcrR family transcriptional regulator [Actinosynnema mirum]ACU38318.1 transcriptional regulator, TetR family [Actinosynnema mirum DSM 43827]AXX31839.1 Transcriptional regulator, TetR family [Actinosynnema pretiosum subsp. pretiosum]QUF04172.1 helix-turn-helix transcriptional regulator [Actinosynnema pretiosum subsp. pretiosum]
MGEDTTARRAGRGARERALAAAVRLFDERGITATTMEEVAAAAPVSKRTLYAHFPTKEDLVLAQLDHLLGSGATMLDALRDEAVPPRERLLGMFGLGLWPRGNVRSCPFLRAATEDPDPDGRAHAFAREQKLVMLALATGLVAELGIAEPEALAEQLVTLSDGVASRAMVLNDPDYGRHARAAAEVLLDHAPRLAVSAGSANTSA